jgi:glycolate oxidase FAD binding subunit
VPSAVAARLARTDKPVTAFRLEGVAPSVTHRKHMLEALLHSLGTLVTWDAEGSRSFWRSVRDAAPFAANAGDTSVLWRISTTPGKGAELAGAITAKADAELFYDWAGGLIWLALPPSDDAGAAAVRRAVAGCGGHATLVRAPAAVRAAVDVFEPQPGPLAALSKRVKDSFDPKGVLNPGRMWAGV